MEYDSDHAVETDRLLPSSNRSSNRGIDPERDCTAANSLVQAISDDAYLDDEIVVYHRRWYILLLFCGLCFVQSMIWNTWGPLTTSVNIAYGWSLGEVALQTNWGSLTYIISTVFFCWLLDVKGMQLLEPLFSHLLPLGWCYKKITYLNALKYQCYHITSKPVPHGQWKHWKMCLFNGDHERKKTYNCRYSFTDRPKSIRHTLSNPSK